MVDAVIFDMDGTLVDSEPVWSRSWGKALARRGLSYPDAFKNICIGCSETRITELIKMQYPDDLEEALAAQQDHIRIGREWILENGVPLKPGATELLRYLDEHGVACGIGSSSWRDVIDSNLAHAGVSDRFACIRSGDEGIPSKPAPDIFLRVAEDLGVEPSRAVVLEDSPTGIRAAHAGGFIPVFVHDLAPLDDEAAGMCAHVCDSLFDVLELFETGSL
jgi:HAD superfamily hydrolase (TIGR01509 family)